MSQGAIGVGVCQTNTTVVEEARERRLAREHVVDGLGETRPGLQPRFPDRFGSIPDAKALCRGFFRWRNAEHSHLGIGLMTPDQVHYGQADDAYGPAPFVPKRGPSTNGASARDAISWARPSGSAVSDFSCCNSK